jgi:hypothetical protein
MSSLKSISIIRAESNSNSQKHTVIYPVRRSGMILTPSFSPAFRFQSSIHCSRPANCRFTLVRPASSQSQNVAIPITASSQARKLKGSNASISVLLIFLMTTLKSSSVIRGSNISGYKLAKVGAKSPFCIQSRFMRIIRVVSYNGESSGTCGFGWGKHGCEGPQGISEALSSISSPSPLVVLECIDVLREFGSDARVGGGIFPFAPASVSCKLGLGKGARWPPSAGSSLGISSLGVGGCEVIGRLLRSRGSPMLVRLLSAPVERSTKRDDGAGLWRLRRCSGRVNRGYSSRVPVLGKLSPNWKCCTGTFGGTGVRGVRGKEFCGFHNRELGGRGVLM